MAHRETSRDEVIAALHANRGLIALAARDLGVSRQALYARIKRDPELLACIEHEREAIVDLAEQKLFEALDKGERWAVMLVLTRLGRHRGWADAPASGGPEGRVAKALEQASLDDLMLSLTTLNGQRR
ncbi:MAG TPA: Fis family transcriptional regulator [Chloroflexus aurantiacus]|jgi:hypothetical protein|uniref:Helix-turn-helix Fis-type n=1 Tax=Chloroflexus aurantiacus (strain ATCC 29366 / DSM 635 / J-10-fl) TaxID=324602 RepID=A9WCW5_CHLAA|nr:MULTISPECIES: helix-turn-helix domain-containing protein [Chloroflexus]ABY33534.1 helix-turn-helix Fis-type [Chloroflexus aurantiacus J-10-fl]GIV89875.1 MAG: Fis family transcriptional regulator [Chloroflexus sp.]HBW67157.1 Fis family transcriptional regulator [Chloroflexus aurantiacus]